MRLTSLIGMSRLKRLANTTIVACQRSGHIFPHTLLYGIGGTGKTAFARAIGEELDYHFVEVHASVYGKQEQLLDALRTYSSQAQGRPLLWFVDEIHRLMKLQEALYAPMIESKIPTSAGFVAIPKFTLLGATTRFDLLDANSFVTRFDNLWELCRYPLDEMVEIVAAHLVHYRLRFTSEVAKDIARRCLGIPRHAVKLAKKMYFAALAAGKKEVTLAECRLVFNLEEIDFLGLRREHRKYMRILDACGSAVGVGAMSATMGQPKDVIEGSVEPVLLQLDFIACTPRGRRLTGRGADFLKKVGETS